MALVGNTLTKRIFFKSLFRTNLPKEVMAFPDFPFPSEWSSFLSHQQVLKYLEDYASHFYLYKYIQFNSIISSVRPLMGKDSQSLCGKLLLQMLILRNLKFSCLMLLLFAVGKSISVFRGCCYKIENLYNIMTLTESELE